MLYWGKVYYITLPIFLHASLCYTSPVVVRSFDNGAQSRDFTSNTKSSYNSDHNMKEHVVMNNVVSYPSTIWTYGIIPYKIDDRFNQTYKVDLLCAMQKIQHQTCLRFRPVRNSDDFYIHFKDHDNFDCRSYVGRQPYFKGMGQELQVNPRCIDFPGIVHEVLHAAGLWHTHQRPDRDSYISINWKNLAKGVYKRQILRSQVKSAFTRIDQIDPPVNTDMFNVPYDYDSIMHYGPDWNEDTTDIIRVETSPLNYMGHPKNIGTWQDTGRFVRLSKGDEMLISAMYEHDCSWRRRYDVLENDSTYLQTPTMSECERM